MEKLKINKRKTNNETDNKYIWIPLHVGSNTLFIPGNDIGRIRCLHEIQPVLGK